MRALWDVGIVFGVASLLYVMLHAELWLTSDPPWLRPLRIMGFLVAAVLVANSFVDKAWDVPVQALLTLWGGDLVIGINALSIAIRVARKRANVTSSLDAN